MDRRNSGTSTFVQTIIMKWQACIKSDQKRYYQIRYDSPLVGFYIYVFEEGRCVQDYLQDTFELAVEFAEEYFGVPRDAWVQIE